MWIIIAVLLFGLLFLPKKSIEPYDHFKDWDKINEILTMPVASRKSPVQPSDNSSLYHTYTACPSDPCGASDSYGEIKMPKKLSERIQELQPPFFDSPQWRDYYNCIYYNDFRYPKRPLPTEFAKDALGYCDKWPYRYPCYIRESRHDIK